jgi:hypothetical protein
MRNALVLWIVGLLTAVPYATFHLLFRAPREQYALLITFVLFWVFGYWGLVGPLLAAVKARAIFRTLEHATSREEFIAALRSPEAREVFIEHIAVDNHIPKFIASRLFDAIARRLDASARPSHERSG